MARVYAAIDPFFPQIDNPENVRTSDELGEEDKPLPKGEYGDFCPVTLTKDSWLYPGSEEFEAQVNERVYKLAGESELETFKADPMRFIKEGVQKPPEPHIMIIGPRGSGVTTQIEMICEKYKVPQFLLKQEFLKKLKEEKEERKKQRLLARGFKPPEPVEDEEEGPPPDPEIEDDPEDFDKEAHEKDVLRKILDANSVLVIDGDWFDLPEDEISMQYTDLLFDSRRPPELVINLSVTEERMLERLLNRDEIETKYQELVDKRNEQKRIKREEDRAAKLAELQEDGEKTPEEIEAEMEEWDKNRDEEEKEDDDPDAPNLEAMLEEQKEKLIESRTTQSDFLEEFVEKIAEKKVPVVKIDGDLEIDRVHLRILNELKPYFELRNSMFERAQVVNIKSEEVKFYENSYLFSLSKYGYNSLFDIARPDMNKNFPLIYRDQLYFFYNEDEKVEFAKTPDVHCKTHSVPKDVWLKPACFVLGTPSCGKSTACERICARTNMVNLKVEEIIPEFIESDCTLGQQLRDEIKGGSKVSEALMVEIILKRTQYADCIKNGYLLEDFPKTREQAEMLSERGLVPDVIFYLNMYSEYCYSRAYSLSNVEFMYDTRVFSERLTTHLKQNSGVTAYYEKHFGNIKYINGLKSKWYVEDTIIDHIRDSIFSKSVFARKIINKTDACALRSINIDRELLSICHSPYEYYCPVTWKNHQTFADCQFMEDTAVLYKHPNSHIMNLYFFRNIEQRDIFLKSPSLFSDEKLFPSKEEIPKLIHPYNAAQIVTKEKNLANYCPVTLYEDDKVVKGFQLFLAFYKDNKFVFESSKKLVRFLSSPFRYAKVTLPVKMPPINENITLLQFPELEDSVPFLEQSIGSIVTRGLLEVTSFMSKDSKKFHLKYPTMSIKETALKLFAMFLKANNPSNTTHTKKKYMKKIKMFLDRCELPSQIYELKSKKDKGKKWTEYQEKQYHELGAKFDKILKIIDQERSEQFMNYIR